ncbi:MAG: tyrosine-type recombinase/integrase [Candidatus Xenobia bacterium]
MRWLDATDAWLETLRSLSRAPDTVSAAERWVRTFRALCESLGASRPEDVMEAHLAAFERHLRNVPGPMGRRYAPASVYQALQMVRLFVRWLHKRGVLLIDSTAEWLLPRPPSGPLRVLSPTEMEALLATPDPTTPVGLRDRAVLELLYDTGLRNAELRQLDLADVRQRERVLVVRHGKGDKPRVVPLGAALEATLAPYLEVGRPQLATRAEEPALFLDCNGHRMGKLTLSHLVQLRACQAGLERVSCHTLRRTYATHLVQNGADVRHVQELLGHSDVGTTTRYLQIDETDLADEHRRTHPRGRRQPPDNLL